MSDEASQVHSQELVALGQVPYVDFPELKFNEHESTEMPFRYVKTEDGKPIMPKVIRPSRSCVDD